MSLWRQTFTGSVGTQSAFRAVTIREFRRLMADQAYSVGDAGDLYLTGTCPLCESPGHTLRAQFFLDRDRPPQFECGGFNADHEPCDANEERIVDHLRIAAVVASAQTPRRRRRFPRRLKQQPRAISPVTTRGLTPVEAAQRLGCSLQFLAQLRSLGKGPTFAYYADGLVGYESSAVEAWAARRPGASASAGVAQ